MSLRLIKPGMGSANLTGKFHPKTGAAIEPLYVRDDGSVVWPGLGAASDDPDDPDFVGGGGGSGGDDDEDEDDEDDEDDDKGKKTKKTKGKKSDDDEDDEDDDEEEEKTPSRPERQAARYRVKLRESEKREAALEARLKAIEDKDKPKDEVAAREAAEAKTKADKAAQRAADLAIENAFLKVNQIQWVDVEDVLTVAGKEGLFEDVVDEDGTVDAKALRVALRDLAKRKPHLVKPKAVSSGDDDNDEEPGSRRTGSTMNGRRRGKGSTPSREELAKKFPVVGRL
jgi:hypothetical protein